ncbi:MAG TPA: PAS domain-containing sensor histidine kinase [Gammaproteobacteria bacterium]|nr:PAS domain-containing sensor histidine kinase [Gammaproteobacteria bacterium]
MTLSLGHEEHNQLIAREWMNTFNSQVQKLLIETIFDHIPQYIFWKNTASVYLGCNKKFAKLLGLNSPDEIIGKSDFELNWLPDGDTAEKFQAGDRKTLEGHHIINQEEWLSVKNGNRILTLANKVPLVNPDGIIVGVLGVATDITEKKRIEERMARSDHQLKGMTVVSASIAHEMRTPLATLKNTAKGIKPMLAPLITGYQAALSHGLNVPTIADAKLALLETAIDTLENKVTEANRIIDMLLTNLQSLRQEKLTHPQKCSARHCINQALAQYGFTKDAPQIIWANDDDFIFYGKEMLLVHVLFNLLKNAIYFIRKADKGNIHIWLEHHTIYNTLHFKDTGTGIKPENLPKIFDPFFTIDTNKGTGIGLAFCEMTLKSFGGSITCHSQWQEYTEFILTLPRKST